MGIKNLMKFLRSHCPEAFTETKISELQYSKAIIDFSLYIFKYISIFGEEHWISAMINLISCLRRNEVHAVFAFDGGAPPEKMQERQDRRDKRDKLDDKINALEAAFTKAKETGEIDQILIDLVKKAEDGTVIKRQRLMGKDVQLKPVINLNLIEREIERIKKQSVKLTDKHFTIAKTIFELFGVPYFQAPMEGESLCADLCIRKKVEYVITEDSDVFAYGCPVLITKLNTSMNANSCIMIKYCDILKGLDFTKEQFLDFCIMCSCDYNKNIPGIGPEKAFKLIKQYKTIENIAATGVDVSILNHVRVRELFTKVDEFNTPIPYCKQPNFEDIERFLFENNIKSVNIDRLKKDFASKPLIFQEDEEEMESNIMMKMDEIEEEEKRNVEKKEENVNVEEDKFNIDEIDVDADKFD